MSAVGRAQVLALTKYLQHSCLSIPACQRQFWSGQISNPQDSNRGNPDRRPVGSAVQSDDCFENSVEIVGIPLCRRKQSFIYDRFMSDDLIDFHQ
jgi:hypothetical protein